MASVLKELYYGNIRLDGRIYTQDSPFVQAAKRKMAALEPLTARLSEEDNRLLEDYLEAQGDVEAIVKYDTFSYALKFGMLLMSEIFMGVEEVLGYKD